MTIRDQLHEAERSIGFTYPPSFFSNVEEFASLLQTENFQRLFPAARLISSVHEIVVTRKSTPNSFIPFMREEQPSWPDIYAFDLDSDGPEFRVSAWSDHAVVMDWASFPVFLQWIHESIATHRERA